MKRSNPRLRLIVPTIIALVAQLIVPGLGTVAHAASAPQFASVVVRLDQLTAQTYTGGTVCVATPNSSAGITGFGSEQYVDIGFPDQEGADTVTTDDFQVNTTPSHWKDSTTLPTGLASGSLYWPSINIPGSTAPNPVAAIAWPGMNGNTATGATNGSYSAPQPASTKVVRFATSGLAVDTTYCFDFRSGTNWTTANPPPAETSGTYSLETSKSGTNGWDEDEPGFVSTYSCTVSCTAPGAGTEIESSNWGTQIDTTAHPYNSITVTGVVPPIFEMDFTSSTDSFPTNLNPNAPVSTTGNTVTVKTNAKGGWMVWTKDQYQGLHSQSANYTIATVPWNTDAPTTLAGNPTTAAYSMNVATAPGASTYCNARPEAEYGSATPYTGGQLTQQWEMAADCSEGGSFTSPPYTDGGTAVTFAETSAINFSTPAASDYTDTIYVTGAGQF
jgi:hypothetical protein